MVELMHVTAAVVIIVIVLILLVVFILKWCLHKESTEGKDMVADHHYVFRRGVSAKPLFSWSDHPSLITDAVENGWSRFGFTPYNISSSTRSSSLLGLCAAVDFLRGNDVELSWEVCQGSADFMQKVRLKSGSSMAAASSAVIKTALPLPGPPLGNTAFPQEAYFEIKILYCHGDDDSGKLKELGEKTKLIHEHQDSHHVINKVDELKSATKDDGKGEEQVMLSMGLTAGGSLPSKLPGTYPGSIGFNSDGSVFLDGIKLIFESEKEDWGKPGKVIGCGFNPKQKKVFFTLDSELVHVINCKSEEFGTPLYPTLAANDDVLVLVNFGQSAFVYSPANGQRTPNPCFIGPVVNSPAAAAALGYEDSKELFSMGRIDSQWLNRCTNKGSHNNYGTNCSTMEFDEESEADLFEIVLDNNNGRSPNLVL
ncbi:hypothetical protein ERO13_D06G019009v2 [Gossypium hirsutum]|uniref:Uncharacterized protein n=3 Tax=Gossypium TaxID=3633 RepID=A0ABM3A7R4_GOSHI|nr:uncharacterized protein LOC121218176 [Gossypium hirsutum]KAB2023481.1 hypothetical protein ES319_D06G021800v1 [Gossypium barbadense]KAG4140444.1 hypothetical protein ERO13_D06G019009v2 [Gossypium hirsutum]TYI75685.1 hypothetical protein E1A91_D06G023500v1 [Gossypium mustelinum]